MLTTSLCMRFCYCPLWSDGEMERLNNPPNFPHPVNISIWIEMCLVAKHFYWIMVPFNGENYKVMKKKKTENSEKNACIESWARLWRGGRSGDVGIKLLGSSWVGPPCSWTSAILHPLPRLTSSPEAVFPDGTLCHFSIIRVLIIHFIPSVMVLFLTASCSVLVDLDLPLLGQLPSYRLQSLDFKTLIRFIVTL